LKPIFKIARSPSRRLRPRDDVDSVEKSLDAALSERRFQPLPEWLEARFHADTGADGSRVLLQAALAAALVNNVTMLAEWTLTPDVFVLAAALHLGLVTPLLLILAACIRSDASPQRRELTGLAIPAVLCLQVAIIYLMSGAPGRAYYLDLFAVIAILGNTSLPLGSRGSLWVTTICLGLMALLGYAPHDGAGRQAPIALGAVMTLHAAFQRERNARRAYMLDLRHRLRVAEVGEEARHDPLTGLANRRRLTEVVEKIWAQQDPLVCPISVVLFDVDRFKAFNDIYGHQAGDDCLRRVAACAAQERSDESSVAARYGGEEFILVLPRTPIEEARRVAERLRAAVVALRIPHGGGEELGVVTASFGVAAANHVSVKFADLTAMADGALYEAKGSGRNRVELARETPAGAATRAA
jgi:diguanylate cyclase (GGDEF)-like protein